MCHGFEQLKGRTANAVALHIPDFTKTFVLVTDASDQGVGAMLANKDAGVLKPIAFFHHTLTSAESRYTTTEKELLEMILAIKRFRVYLGKPFDLITDHQALKWLETLNMDDCRGRRAGWLEVLQQYEINPIHKAGKSKELPMAHYLFRIGADGQLVATVQSQWPERAQ